MYLIENVEPQLVLPENRAVIEDFVSQLAEGKTSYKNVLDNAINFYNSELNKQQEKSNNLCDIKDNKKFDSRNKKILKKTKTINKLFKKKIKDEKILKRNNSFDKKNIIKKEKNKKINILKIDELLDISNIKAEDENVINDEKSETKGITPPSRRSSTSSFGDSSIIAKDIPKKYLENPIDFVNYIEYELPNDKKNKVNDKFIIKQYEENNDINIVNFVIEIIMKKLIINIWIFVKEDTKMKN